LGISTETNIAYKVAESIVMELLGFALFGTIGLLRRLAV
jgi:hypothetical protein